MRIAATALAALLAAATAADPSHAQTEGAPAPGPAEGEPPASRPFDPADDEAVPAFRRRGDGPGRYRAGGPGRRGGMGRGFGHGPTLRISTDQPSFKIEFECNAEMEACLAAIERVYEISGRAQAGRPDDAEGDAPAPAAE